jgi:hypothetical protein
MAQQGGTQQPVSSLAAYGVAQPLPAASSTSGSAAPVSSLSKYGTAQALPSTAATSGSNPSGMSDDDVKGSVIDALGNTQLVPGGQMGVGLLKGVGDTAYGLGRMIPGVRSLLPDQEPSYLKSSNPEQTVGKVGEGVAEFAAGDAALEGMAKLTKVPETVLALAEKYPKAAKMIHAAVQATKGAVVGGAQGAVKGSAEGDAVGGAEGGAAGGALGGAVGGALAPAEGNAVDSLTRAIRPTGKLAQNFAEKAELALPRLIEEHQGTPITNLDDLSDAAHTAADKLWKNEVMPQIQKHAEDIIPGKPVADAIRGGVLPGDKDLFAGTADAADEFAKKFDANMTLQQASDRLQSMNRKLSSLYKLDPASRYAATANSPTVEAMESGANELRAQIYSKLTSLGEDDPAGLRQTYGALKTVEQAAEKRAIVHNRLAPINLSQQLATAGGVLHAAGHLIAGDVPGAIAGAAPILAAKAAKTLNSPEYLIGKGLAETGGAGARLAEKAGDAGANLGSQAGQAVAAPGDEQ